MPATSCTRPERSASRSAAPEQVAATRPTASSEASVTSAPTSAGESGSRFRFSAARRGGAPPGASPPGACPFMWRLLGSEALLPLSPRKSHSAVDANSAADTCSAPKTFNLNGCLPAGKPCAVGLDFSKQAGGHGSQTLDGQNPAHKMGAWDWLVKSSLSCWDQEKPTKLCVRTWCDECVIPVMTGGSVTSQCVGAPGAPGTAGTCLESAAAN